MVDIQVFEKAEAVRRVIEQNTFQRGDGFGIRSSIAVLLHRIFARCLVHGSRGVGVPARVVLIILRRQCSVRVLAVEHVAHALGKRQPNAVEFFVQGHRRIAQLSGERLDAGPGGVGSLHEFTLFPGQFLHAIL